MLSERSIKEAATAGELNNALQVYTEPKPSHSAWLMHGGLINLLSSKSFRLSTRARVTVTNGQLNNAVSTDCSNVQRSIGSAIACMIEPLVIIAGAIALCILLGPTALVVSHIKIQ